MRATRQIKGVKLGLTIACRILERKKHQEHPLDSQVPVLTVSYNISQSQQRQNQEQQLTLPPPQQQEQQQTEMEGLQQKLRKATQSINSRGKNSSLNSHVMTWKSALFSLWHNKNVSWHAKQSNKLWLSSHLIWKNLFKTSNIMLLSIQRSNHG
jgi:hypothetical protein